MCSIWKSMKVVLLIFIFIFLTRNQFDYKFQILDFYNDEHIAMITQHYFLPDLENNSCCGVKISDC